MANEAIKGMGFHHIALRTTDFERSLEFYKALGMKPVIEWGEGMMTIAMFDIGDGGRFEIFANRGVDYPPEGRLQHFAFKVDDVVFAYEHALSVGAKEHTKPKTVPLEDARPNKATIQVAFVTGPDGELLEFFREI